MSLPNITENNKPENEDEMVAYLKSRPSKMSECVSPPGGDYNPLVRWPTNISAETVSLTNSDHMCLLIIISILALMMGT